MKKNCLTGSSNGRIKRKWGRIMRLTFLLMVGFIFSVSAKSYSQTTRLSIDLKNQTITDVIEHVEENSEFVFLYKNEDLDLDKKVTINLENVTIDKILDVAFKEQSIDYDVYKRQIVLRKAEKTNSLNLSTQQQKTITGVVTDSEGLPLPGVTVIVKNTTVGTVTNGDGSFSLTIPDDAETLQLSFVGMRTQEIPIGERTTFTAVMEVDAIGIEEVVAIGYGTMKKSDLTGSVVRVDQDVINERPNVSVVQSIHGSVPGLNIGQVNTSGGEPGISIRGETSLSGVGSPLIVLDGVIFRGNLIDINPHDIESIDILKDASSAAIYGSQASNGVIIITTTKKSSIVGKPMINYNGSYSFESPANHLGVERPDEFIQRMSNADLFFSRTEESGYLEPNPNYDVTDRFRTNNQIDAYRNGIVTDWNALLTNENMHTQNHNLSITNRTKNSGYLVSVGYTDQMGYLVNEEYSRWNTRINLDNSITDWLDIGFQSFMTFSDYSGESVSPSNIYSNHAYAPAYKEDGSLLENPDGLGINPLYIFDADDYDKRLNLFGNINVNVDIPFIKGLSFRTNYSNNYRAISKYYYRPYASNFQGEGSKMERINVDWTNDNILSYKNTFNKVHNLDLTFVYGIEKRNSKYTSATASVFIKEQLGYNRLQAGSSELQTANSGAWEEVSLYNMARLFYGFNQKYLFTGTIRRDGFSGFGEQNKFGLFPSASAAWVLSEENFIKENFVWLDYLKIRLSYGANGNRTVGRYQTLAKVEGGYNYLDGSKSSVYTQSITDLASPNLKWETTTGVNIGLDFSIVNQRINGNIEYYNNNTTDLLYNVDIPGISRFENFPDNLGKIHNHGIELSLNSLNVTRNDFEWRSSFVISRNRNEIRELLGFDLDGDGKEDDLISERLFIGEPISTIYDYKITGELWQLDEEIPQTADLGAHKIVDINEDGTIHPENDRTIIGYNSPSFRFSLDNKLKYKNWMLGIFINSVQGGKKYYLGQDNLENFNSISGNMLFTRSFPPGLDYWLPENPDARYQKLYIDIPSNLRATRYMPRSFIRLQDVTLSYSFPEDLLKDIKIADIRIYFNGKNLYTWTKWTGWDPETGQGITMNGRPVLKSYTFGIDVKF